MNGVLEYLRNNNNSSMSLYYSHDSNEQLFQIRDVTNYDNIILHWLYDKFCICYYNITYDIKIARGGSHNIKETLYFGNVIFQRLIYTCIEIHNYKKEGKSIMNIIKKYFAIDNEIHVYRPSSIELNMKINERQKPGNTTCCVCYELKNIENPLFNCSHNELCFDCFIHCSVCPLCRSA